MINVNRKYSEVAKLKDLAKLMKQMRADDKVVLEEIARRLDIIERQLERMSAPQYRQVRAGKRK